MCKGGTAAGKTVLWTRHECRIRILRGLILLMLDVITHLVMCSGRNCNTVESGFGGLEVACWPLVPKLRVQTRPKPSDFSGRKNPQHAFLRRGSKAVGPM